MRIIFILIVILFAQIPLFPADWNSIREKARGQTVDWYMWGGFPAANKYVNGYVASQVAKKFGVRVRQVPVQDISEIVSKLLVEKQAGKKVGQADLLWINGENFRTCKKFGLLYGPFAAELPNSKLIDKNDPTINCDFGENVDGLESPWGKAQFVMIYDSLRTPKPPRSIQQLLQWIKNHPGRFTYPAPPDFTGSAFIRHVFYHFGDPHKNWQKGYDKRLFLEKSQMTFAVLKQLAPFLWREGKTYPESPAKLYQLFADQEIDFAMSYHPREASKYVNDGVLPKTVKTYIFDEGTIANTHFLAIPFNSKEKEGAMVLANFLLSPEAQLEKAKISVWGDLPAIMTCKLNASLRQKFLSLGIGSAGLSPEAPEGHKLPEASPDILLQLEKGWERYVLRGTNY